MISTPEQLAKLPKWAQDYVRCLRRQRDEATTMMTDLLRTRPIRTQSTGATEMNERERAKHMAEVMMHYANGGEVQFRTLSSNEWHDGVPVWNWKSCEYRIKPRTVTIEFDPLNGDFGSHDGLDFVPRKSISEAHRYDDEVWVRVPTDLVEKIVKG